MMIYLFEISQGLHTYNHTTIHTLLEAKNFEYQRKHNQ